MREPIQLTQSAYMHIQNMVDQKNLRGFRLAVQKDGCSGWSYQVAAVDRGKDNDLCIWHDQLPIYIDRQSIPLLQGTIVDYVDLTLGQKQLVFRNPNVDQHCGCGESFSVKQSSNSSVFQEDKVD